MDDSRRPRITPTRVIVWVLVGGLGVYLVSAGALGIITKGQ